jgi:hypothetical protein
MGIITAERSHTPSWRPLRACAGIARTASTLGRKSDVGVGAAKSVAGARAMRRARLCEKSIVAVCMLFLGV